MTSFTVIRFPSKQNLMHEPADITLPLLIGSMSTYCTDGLDRLMCVAFFLLFCAFVGHCDMDIWWNWTVCIPFFVCYWHALVCSSSDNSTLQSLRSIYIIQAARPTRCKYANRKAHSWWCGIVVSSVHHVNEVNALRAHLVLGWVTVFGWVYHLGIYPAN